MALGRPRRAVPDRRGAPRWRLKAALSLRGAPDRGIGVPGQVRVAEDPGQFESLLVAGLVVRPLDLAGDDEIIA